MRDERLNYGRVNDERITTDESNDSQTLDEGLTERRYTRFPSLDLKKQNELTDYERAELEADGETLVKERNRWKRMVELLRLNRRKWLSMHGVTAVDIGYKVENGKFLDKVALRVHVERKLHPDFFKDRKYDEIPEEIKEGEEVYDVDVIEANYKLVQLTEPPRPRTVLETPQQYANRRRRLDPLVGGISIGSPQVPVGTLGALVWDRVDGSVCILSNWHVLAGDLSAQPGHPCFQPGLFDQGRSGDVVARLKRWSLNRHTDAAIAELTGSRHYCAGEIVSLFQQISGETRPHLGMRVLKSGRSSGFSQGFIDGLYFSAAIEYSHGVVRVFEEQIHIAPVYPGKQISEPGDSGSLWVTETKSEGYKAVGLHFAGDLPHSAFGEYALANPMIIVADRLNFSFRPLFLEIRDEDVLLSSVQNQNVTGGDTAIEPIGFPTRRFTGSGGQPDPIQFGPTGNR